MTHLNNITSAIYYKCSYEWLVAYNELRHMKLKCRHTKQKRYGTRCHCTKQTLKRYTVWVKKVPPPH